MMVSPNGDQLINDGKGQGIKFNIQGFLFSMVLFVLELAGCDMVLGEQWLQTLGTISWNFKKLTMPLPLKGRILV